MRLVRTVPREKRTASKVYFCHWAKLIGGWLLLGYKSEDGVKAFPEEFSFQFSFFFSPRIILEGEKLHSLQNSLPLTMLVHQCSAFSSSAMHRHVFFFKCSPAEKELISAAKQLESSDVSSNWQIQGKKNSNAKAAIKRVRVKCEWAKPAMLPRPVMHRLLTPVLWDGAGQRSGAAHQVSKETLERTTGQKRTHEKAGGGGG